MGTQTEIWLQGWPKILGPSNAGGWPIDGGSNGMIGTDRGPAPIDGVGFWIGGEFD